MHSTHHDSEHLQRCRKQIEQKLQWPPAEEWRHYEFTGLSEKILETTGVHLSVTTLKRVFGKLKYDSLPSSVTLNALANYIGYPSWAGFKSQQPVAAPELTTIKNKRAAPRKTWIIVAAAVVACAILAFTFLPGRSSSAITNPGSIIFTSKPLAEGLPNSVVFKIDVKENRPGSTVIQQSWDSTKTILLQPGQTEATGIYYFPGYFRAKLLLDKKIVKEHDLFIRADKWMATIDHEPVPTYVKPGELVTHRGMTIDENVLMTIRKTTTPVFLTYHLVRPFNGLQSDDFSLEAAIQNTYGEGAAICKTMKVFVLCSKGAFIIPFTIPGCASDINLKLNDRYLGGKSNDLSVFGIDPTLVSPLKLQVRNRNVQIFLHGKLVREERYKEDAGEVVGLRFSFLGAGRVQYVKLSDGHSNIVYEDRFEN